MFGRGRQEVSKLLEAAWEGDEATVKAVLVRNVDLLNSGATKSISRNQPQWKEGDTALHLAARQGHRRIVAFLMNLRAVVIASSASGATPLHDAVAEGHEDIAQLLLEHGADPDSPDSQGRTPLHDAALGGHHDVAQLLLARGAQANTKDSEGNTPLHEAAKNCSQPLARLLTKAGANVNEGNAQGRTPLHVAIVHTDHSALGLVAPQPDAQRGATTQLVTSLLEWGADVNAVDEVGETALDLMSYLEGEVGSDLVDLLRGRGGQWVRYRHRHPEAATAPVAEVAATGPAETRSEGTVAGSSPGATSERQKGRSGGPIQLGAEPFLIGRGTDCDLRYESRTLSRRHARVERTADGYVITDLNSHNGTLIDDTRILEPHLLKAGERISLGAYKLEFDGSQLISLRGELSQERLREERQAR